MKTSELTQVTAVLYLCSALLPTLQAMSSGPAYMFTMTEEPTTVTTAPTTTLSPVYCEEDYACVNCSVARVCAPVEGESVLRQLYEIQCSGSTPWCSGGVCVSEEPDSCSAPTPVPQLFTCMRDGFFPDVTNCSRYYLCESGLPYLQECPENNPYYYPDRQKCFDSGSGYDQYCASASNPCTGYDGAKQPIGNSTKYFAYCMENEVVWVDRCIGAYVLDSGNDCAPSCPHPGLFPDKEDCMKYYQCTVGDSTPAQTTYVMISDLSCPDGQGFLEHAYQCVETSSVPNCNVSSSAFFN